MKIKLLAIGKTDDKQVELLSEKYASRLKHYIGFDFDIIPDLKKSKNRNIAQQKLKEGEEILKKLEPSDFLILFDERGREFSSKDFAGYLQKRMNAGTRRAVFLIGGPYGFSEQVYSRANAQISLSKMTFSHQMIRPFAIEQIYRAFTILKNEPYHHQ